MRKELIVIQQDLKDCGVCCLLSIIKYYHGYVPLEKLRIDTSTSLEGTNAYQLIKAAKSYGFDAIGKKLDTIDKLNNKIIYPCIAHIETEKFSHFVVIFKSLEKKLIIMDPAKGKVIIDKDKFSCLWTNIIIELYPKRKIVYIKPNKYISKFTFKIIKENKRHFLKIFILKLFLIFLTIIISFHFKINTLIYNEKAVKTFKIFSIYFLIGYFFKIIFSYLENCNKNILEKNIDEHIYHDFLNRLFLLPDNFIKNRTTGEIMTRVDELSSIKEFYSNIILSTFLESILVIISGIVLFSINQILFLVLCLFLIIYAIFGTIYSKSLFNKIILNIESTSIFNAKIIEDLDVYTTIKNLGVLDKINNELNSVTKNHLNNNFQLNKYLIKFNSISDICEQMLQFFIIVFGFILIFRQKLNTIDLYTFLILISYPINYIKNLIVIIPKYNYIKACVHKISDYFDIPIEKDNKANQFSYGAIKITNLCYNLNPNNKLFENLNLEINENSFVMLKGSSGCGKSTLCKLIAGINKEDNLPITINNIGISDLTKSSLEKNITYVGQRENLIQDNIKNNILFYREVSNEMFDKIISICQINEIISKKPLGLESLILKDSLNLSGGEKQRIVLARALLNNFKILILDEALSEVNDDLETKIINDLKNYLKDKIVIYVTHKNHEKYFDKVIDLNKQRAKEV